MQSRNGPWTARASGALGMHLRVKFDGSDELELAGVEDHLGTLKEEVLAADELATVIPPNEPGSKLMIANGAIGIGDDVYPAASGKVTGTIQGRRIGKALSVTTTDGDWVEVQELPYDASDAIASGPNALTGASMAVTAAMCKNGHVTTSHSGAAAVNLPAGFEGARVTITKIDANAAAHTVTPNGAEKIQGAGTFAAMDAQFDSVTLEWLGSTVGWNIVGKHIA